MLADPNTDLLNQLTRIANALSKPSPSPWIEWAKTLASFVAGIALTYIGIALQGSLGDRREQRKMRRIIYVELTNSFRYLFSMVSDLRTVKKSPRVPNSTGEIHPLTVRLIHPPFTSEAESASEIGLTRRLGEEEYCKNRAQDGAILAVPVRMADRRECSDRKIDSQYRDQARWALQWCRFRGQKGNSG